MAERRFVHGLVFSHSEGDMMMREIAGLQRTLEQFARSYGLWVIVGLMVLEFFLEWQRQRH